MDTTATARTSATLFCNACADWTPFTGEGAHLACATCGEETDACGECGADVNADGTCPTPYCDQPRDEPSFWEAWNEAASDAREEQDRWNDDHRPKNR